MRVVVPTVKPAAVEETDTYLRAVAAAPAFEGLHVLTTVRSGEAPQEIIAAFVSEQGDRIRVVPPARGFDLIAWVGPGAAILVAAGGVL